MHMVSRLSVQEKTILSRLVDDLDVSAVLAKVLDLEKVYWLGRLAEAALDQTKDPRVLIEYATRADQWGSFLNALIRHAKEERPQREG